MQVVVIAPNKALIGIQNQKLDVFDDGIQLQKAGGFKKIQAIRVFYTEKYIRGFEIFYKLFAGDLLKAGHNVPKSKKELQNTILEIGPDDYVSEIFGAYQSAKKNRIINITFVTYRGKALTFGGRGDKSFGFCFPGFTFGAFKGGNSQKKCVEWLEIDVLPLPEDFKLEMQKLGILRIQRISEQPERNLSNSTNSAGQGALTGVPKLQIAKPMIAVPAIVVPQINQQQNINLQQQQPQQGNPYQQQQQQYQQYPQQQQYANYPQQQQQQQYPQYLQQQSIPNQQNPYAQALYNQQPQSQNPYSSNSYPKFN
ncbi:unnamed protein product (macronuclear) [Paramecium tetraurelia]|uniref:Jacalin-type lectin domain-containing protein n=1 Tax=Paramecium tetraurelia TaxID=5888 RepID=A0C353_PARTE|nr:uncharacterized protein GSPATT00034698001 [Paramecium tetraurelia]CAK65220.1 unnamed protein product [Paramecium tetraurelia]|eukprot:XP_001432617.1 hypothetical protein (macronuclear) [Paramecium tetraurelia strain d4-2]